MNAEKAENADLHAKILRGVSPLLIEGGELRGQLTLREIVLRIWRGKWIIVATMAIVVALVVGWMKMKSPLYTAAVVVAPASDAGAGGLASRLSQYSGIAALAGIDLPSNEVVTPFRQFTEIMTSPVVAERLAKKYDIMPTIFAGRWSWSPTEKVWTRQRGLLSPVTGWAREFFGLPPRPPPSVGQLADYLHEKISMSEIELTGMQRIMFRHKDPVFAVQMLAALHKEADGVIREESEMRTSRQIAYIERKLQTTTAADHRRSLVQLLLDQEKQMMMIQVNLPFAARIIEPPIASSAPTSPKPKLFLAGAIVLGAMLGIFIVFLIDALRPGPNASGAVDIQTARREDSTVVNAPTSASSMPDNDEKPPPVAAVNT